MSISDNSYGKEKNENPISPEKAMPVSLVLQEYIFINDFRCGCEHGGKLKLTRQLLTSYDKRPMDVLTAMCEDCGAEYKFYFDISRVRSITGQTMREVFEERSAAKLAEEAHSRASGNVCGRFGNWIKNILDKMR